MKKSWRCLAGGEEPDDMLWVEGSICGVMRNGLLRVCLRHCRGNRNRQPPELNASAKSSSAWGLRMSSGGRGGVLKLGFWSHHRGRRGSLLGVRPGIEIVLGQNWGWRSASDGLRRLPTSSSRWASRWVPEW